MRETPDSSKAFEKYYDFGGDRSLEALARQMHQESLSIPNEDQTGTKHVPTVAGILSQLKKWSVAHEWQNRIIQRDRAQAEKERQKRAKAVEQMNNEHALIGRTQALRAVKQIQDLMDAKKFGPLPSVQLFKIATDLERVARGASTEQFAITGKDGDPITVHHEETQDLTEDDLKIVAQMAEELRRRKETTDGNNP